jgi:hypothetical protein
MKDDQSKSDKLQIIAWLITNCLIVLYIIACWIYICRFRKREILSEVNIYINFKTNMIDDRKSHFEGIARLRKFSKADYDSKWSRKSNILSSNRDSPIKIISKSNSNLDNLNKSNEEIETKNCIIIIYLFLSNSVSVK